MTWNDELQKLALEVKRRTRPVYNYGDGLVFEAEHWNGTPEGSRVTKDEAITRMNEIMRKLYKGMDVTVYRCTADAETSEESACECGSDACGSPTHSEWCPCFERL